MHGDGVVARLLLLLLHGCNEVDHALAICWNPDLGPAVEVELAHHTGLLLLAGRGLQEGSGSQGACLMAPPQEQPRPLPQRVPCGSPEGHLAVGHPKAQAEVFPSEWGAHIQGTSPGTPLGPTRPCVGSLAALLERTEPALS